MNRPQTLVDIARQGSRALNQRVSDLYHQYTVPDPRTFAEMREDRRRWLATPRGAAIDAARAASYALYHTLLASFPDNEEPPVWADYPDGTIRVHPYHDQRAQLEGAV